MRAEFSEKTISLRFFGCCWETHLFRCFHFWYQEAECWNKHLVKTWNSYFVKTWNIFLLKRFLFPAPLYSRTTDRGGGENNWNCKLSPTGNLNIPNRGEPCHHRHHHHHHHHHNDDDHHSFPHNVMFLISIQIWRQMGAAV